MQRFSMRATLLLSEILKARRNLGDASSKLMRAADSKVLALYQAELRSIFQDVDKLSGAMLQEQAAFCYLYLNPPLCRKFVFRLVLAGQNFNSINQVRQL
jgi:hypothetical protein